MVGVIQVVGLMITPAATAYLLCERLSRMMLLAALFGVTSVVGGIYLMCWTGNFPPGAAIVLVSTMQFLFLLTVAPRYGLVAGWLRRFRLVPEQIIEDVVGCIYRGNRQPLKTDAIKQYVDSPIALIQRALNALVRRDWVSESSDGFRLTSRGEREAKRLLRAHRLWEAYLEHVGVAGEEVHAQAHVLEHMHDQATVDYLDDKLGHPTHDPHGKEIPEDVAQLAPGREVKAALLREGHRGVIVAVGEAAVETALQPQDLVTVGPRRGDDQIWTLRLSDGRDVELDHRAADAVIVRLFAASAASPTPHEAPSART